MATLDEHDLRCVVAKVFMDYIESHGIEWDWYDGPLEIGQFLDIEAEDEEEEYERAGEMDEEQRGSSAEAMARIEAIIDAAVSENTTGMSADELRKLYRRALLECVLGQSYEQVEYRAK